LAQILNEGAREEAYDGLIIIAAQEIASSLKRALSPETSALLIGNIVRDLPSPAARDLELPAQLSH
jgi:protein required for attachment to host cells